MILRRWGPITLFVVGVCGRDLPLCVEATEIAIETLKFVDFQDRDFYESRCESRLKLVSLYASLTLYCEPHDISTGVDELEAECAAQNATLIRPSEFSANLTEEAIGKLRVIERFEVDSGEELATSVLISQKFFSLARKTKTAWETEVSLHRAYGFASYAFWGSVILIGIIHNIFTHIRGQHLAYFRVDSNDHEPTTSRGTYLLDTLNHYVRAYLTLPAGWKSYHLRLYYWCTIPTRAESILLFIFWIMSTVLCCINYHTFHGNLYWPEVNAQLGRYVADRTGVMSYANLPILWLFSGRNNVLLWATGWNFTTFNIYHRHIARVATIQAVLHSIAYTILIGADGGTEYMVWLKQPWFYLGIIATILMSTLLGFSSIWLRMHYYEIFLLIHITFSIVIIITLFVHTSIFSGEYDGYLWPLVAVWGIDRVLRLIRLAYCNFRVTFRKHIISTSRSTIEYSSASNVLRVVIAPGNKALAPSPGQHYYLYAPFQNFGWKGWESHPFTLAAWDFGSNAHNIPASSSYMSEPHPGTILGDEIPTPPPDDSSIHLLSRSNSLESSAPMLPRKSAANGLIFYIRPFDGFTRRLRDLCIHTPNKQVSVRFLLEGPYGSSAPLRTFDTVLLIAGGTGIAGALPYLREYLHEVHANTSSMRTQRVRLVWATQQEAFIHEVAERELRPALACSSIHVEFFATGSNGDDPKELGFEGETENLCAGDASDAVVGDLEIQRGRPNVPAQIRSALGKHGAPDAQLNRVGILVCGPGGMADVARETVGQVMREGVRNVEYFEEAYGW